MTEKMTKNDIKCLAACGKIYYTDMNVPTLKYFNKVGYNSGIYGWNFLGFAPSGCSPCAPNSGADWVRLPRLRLVLAYLAAGSP